MKRTFIFTILLLFGSFNFAFGENTPDQESRVSQNSLQVASVEQQRIQQKTLPPAHSQWSASYYMLTEIQANQVYSGKYQDGEAYNEFSLVYSASNGYEWTLQPKFTYAWAQEGSVTSWLDPTVKVAKGEVAQWGKVNLNLGGAMDLPLTPSSQDSGRWMASIESELVRKWPKKWELGYVFSPNFFRYRESVYSEQTDDGEQLQLGREQFAIYHGISLSYKGFSNFKPYQVIHLWQQWNHKAADSELREEDATLEYGVEWQFASKASLSLGFGQSRSTIRPEHSFKLLQAPETKYNVSFSADL